MEGRAATGGQQVGRKRTDPGFSLIELLIVMAVLAVLSSVFVLSPKVFRQKEIDKYTKTLCNQIREMQTLTMAKAGKWRLSLYREDSGYYCVQEMEEKGDTDTAVWTEKSGHTGLGTPGAISFTKMGEGEGGEPGSGGADAPIFIWRFNRDTGACIQGAGTYEISGLNKIKHIKIYAQSGRCEEIEHP